MAVTRDSSSVEERKADHQSATPLPWEGMDEGLLSQLKSHTDDEVTVLDITPLHVT